MDHDRSIPSFVRRRRSRSFSFIFCSNDLILKQYDLVLADLKVDPFLIWIRRADAGYRFPTNTATRFSYSSEYQVRTIALVEKKQKDQNVYERKPADPVDSVQQERDQKYKTYNRYGCSIETEYRSCFCQSVFTAGELCFHNE